MQKAKLQAELLKVQKWASETGQKFVMLFEGRDAAGKGGTIKRFMEHLNPREARVVALNKPTDHERGQWYFQRYVEHLPTAGEIVLYDRSWYNRAGVERVMGFCEPNDYLEFMRQTPDLERMLVRSGIQLYKYWFSVTQAEQRRRFASRERDPLKRWKLSPIDRASLDKWEDYTEAKEAMFFYTDTADAPWTVIKVRRQEARAAQLHAALPQQSRLPGQGSARRPCARSADRRAGKPRDPPCAAHPWRIAASGHAPRETRLIATTPGCRLRAKGNPRCCASGVGSSVQGVRRARRRDQKRRVRVGAAGGRPVQTEIMFQNSVVDDVALIGDRRRRRTALPALPR